MIRWFAHNPVAANLLMIAILLGGGLSLYLKKIPLEVFPEFEFSSINIQTRMSGATPASVEEGVTVKIEEAIHDLEGIKKLSSRSSEGSSLVRVEVAKGFDSRELLNEIKLRVDGISTLPADADSPVIDIPARVREVISVVVSGDFDERTLHEMTTLHRDRLLNIDGISTIEIDNPRKFELSIEIEPAVLDALNLSLQDVSDAINASSLDISAGNLRSAQGEILVRTYAQAYDARDYANIPIVTGNNTRAILLGDIATINDGFDENASVTLFNGKPAKLLDIYRTGDQSAIQVADKVKAYMEEQEATLPEGLSLSFWRDRSKVVKGRLGTLLNSAWQGGLLVILLLSLFLRPSVAAWVCLGIPVSFMGAILLMPAMGVTLNVISMFAFILVLGIVVDDAIVTGENIYRHMRMGKDSLSASVEGTLEVSIPVTFGILTTVAAFIPLFMIEGARGQIFAQIPAIVIPVLLFSLVESKLILPAHLRHVTSLNDRPQNILSRIQQGIANGFENAILRFYRPVLRACISNKLVSLSSVLLITFLIFSMVSNGWISFSFFPRIEREVVSASLTMPVSTHFETTDKHIRHMVNITEKLQEKYRNEETGKSAIVNIISTSGGRGSSTGGHLGRVSFEVLPPEQRDSDITVRGLLREWRRMIGQIPGAEQLSFRAEFGRGGEPIEVELRGQDLDELKAASEQIKNQLQSYDGLFDIQDNLSDGKEEFQISLKPDAYSLDVSLIQIASQIRQGVYGLETQRLQRGREEVSVMLRFPLEQRSSLEDLYNLPIRLNNGKQVLLSEVATITPGNSPSSLYRIDRFRTLTVSSDADKQNTNLEAIKADLNQQLPKILVNYPGVDFILEGEAKEQRESLGSAFTGLIFILFAIYALLAIPFKSYGQPLIVMSIIPIGAVGAILGHQITGFNLSIMSIMGMLALTGVVINDSLVLVDYINKQRRRGAELMEAVLTAGTQRFRPVMLTSLTTFAGLTPLLLEKSTQAEFLKPMAISLGFGILFATFITLLVIPVNYVIYVHADKLFKRMFLKPVKI